MKQLKNLLWVAAATTALVIPDEIGGGGGQKSIWDLGSQDRVQAFPDASSSWWEAVAGESSQLSSVGKALGSKLDQALRHSLDALSVLPGSGHDHGDHDHGGHHGDPTKTIYELIKESKYSERFAKLVDEHDEIKKLLQETDKENRTVFVPTDRAFERLPHHKKPSDEFILDLLRYHILPGSYPAGRVLFSHTLPTHLEPHDLGHRRQRLRVSLGLFGVRLNFFAKLVATNIVAKNGLIHAVDAILVPPPSIDKIVSLLPGKFSTFSLAMENTGLGKDLDESDDEWHGATVFAPTNRAFVKLGPRANAFLFSDRGSKYLRALLKYHIVANQTLYSDKLYKKEGDGDHDEDGDHDHDHDGKGRRRRRHPRDSSGVEMEDMSSDFWAVDLPSLLGAKPIHVDIRRWKGFVSMTVNGKTHVSIQDGIANDGVIQVVDSVLIPRCHHRHHDHDHDHDHDGDGDGDDDDKRDAVYEANGEVNVDELKLRLQPLLDGADDTDGSDIEQGTVTIMSDL